MSLSEKGKIKNEKSPSSVDGEGKEGNLSHINYQQSSSVPAFLKETFLLCAFRSPDTSGPFHTERSGLSLRSSFSLFTCLPIVLVAVLILTSCEYSFDPTLENDRYHFSIYGTLDASADTQWVRIMPLRDSLFLAPKPIDATVTLQHITSDKTVVLNDSLFRYGSNVYAWNFWTTEKLLQDETYRLVAERPDGQTSSAFATLPADFQVLEVNYSCGGFFADILQDLSVRIESVERLVMVEMVYHYRMGSQEAERTHRVYRHLQNKTELSDDRIQIVLNYQADLSKLAGLIGLDIDGLIRPPQLGLRRVEVIIASAGPDWPDTEGLDFEEQALPDTVTNVENGVGVLAAIVSKTLPIDIDRCGS